MSAVDDVFFYLEDQGLAGGSTGWDLIRRRVTDAPADDKLVVVSEDGGRTEMPTNAGIGDSALGDVGVIVDVRAGQWDGDASKEKAEDILTALHGLRGVVLGASGSPSYIGVRAMTPEPVFAGFDDQGRPHHTVSFRLLKLV